MKKRIYYIAKDLNVDSKEIIDYLNNQGHVKVASDGVPRLMERLIASHFDKSEKADCSSCVHTAVCRGSLANSISAGCCDKYSSKDTEIILQRKLDAAVDLLSTYAPCDAECTGGDCKACGKSMATAEIDRRVLEIQEEIKLHIRAVQINNEVSNEDN